MDGAPLASYLDSSWPLDDDPGLREQLKLDWSEDHRGYHDLTHLAEVLQNIDYLSTSISVDMPVLQLAAWFHDAINDGERDAEERSARWAREALDGRSIDLEEISRLILLTEAHDPEEGDLLGAIFCDSDLGVLGSSPERYRDYASGVAKEYVHYSDEVYRRGRSAVLESLLEKEHIYSTAIAREAWEQQARMNIQRELDGFQSQISVA